MLSREYCEIFMNSFFYRTPLAAASEKYEYIVYMLDLLKVGLSHSEKISFYFFASMNPFKNDEKSSFRSQDNLNFCLDILVT